jgi:hypothetical protein
MSLSHDLESQRHILMCDIFSTSKLFSGLLEVVVRATCIVKMNRKG